MVTFTNDLMRDIERAMQFSIGFEPMFSRLTRDVSYSSTYPPYNIVNKDDYRWTIELALAGFSQDDIEVEVKEGTLTVKSKKVLEEKERDYLHKGIGMRRFERRFSLGEDVIVNGADLKDGMLYIQVERVIPEEKKPRSIPIGTGSGMSSSSKEFLTE